ncbi:MAG: N-acetylmuramic acid 6-phosphate etherase [Thermoanaerobaculia bacterium]
MSHERLDASLEIDTVSPREIVRIIQAEDARVAGAVAAAAPRIAEAIEQIADRLRNGGRLFYAGAGTSGRIAMLDASELPPTYGIEPEMVQVIMAGGEAAFLSAVEGAEDRDEDAIAAVNARVRPEDAVVGIAASGTTPFTIAAVRRANMIGALTISITSVPNSPLAREADIPIVADTGPEVILGSTRMKSGTAQKMILNTLSTGVMVLLGRVYSNLMVDMPATNDKLRRRAMLMVQLAAKVTPVVAQQALRDSGGDTRLAIVIARRRIPADEAQALLERAGGDLRKALES